MNLQHQHTTLQLLLDEWNKRHASMGTGTALRIQQIIQILPDDCEPAQMRNMLAAILVKSPDEQAEFYQVFKKCEQLAAKISGEQATISEDSKEESPAVQKAKNRLRNAIIYLLALGLVVAGILYWTIENKPENLSQFREIRIQVSFGETQENIDLRTPLLNDTAQLQLIEPSNHQRSQKGHSVFVDSIGFAAFTANGDSVINVRDTFEANLFYSNRKDSIRLIATILPAIKPAITKRGPLQELELRYPDDISRLIIDPEEQAEIVWWKKMEWPIKLSLMLFLGALLWGIWRWYQYKKAKVVAELKKADKAPYIWNPETNEINEEWLEEVTRPLLNRFRGRTPVDNILIDIPATIAATSKQAGRLDLQYQYRTLPPNYLLLIDRFDGQDHQARLFDALYQSLKKAEVPVFRYYYNGDPRVCHNEAFPIGITLVELLHKHASARLLMVGEGLSFLSPVSGRLSPWTSIVKKWSNRALLSPKSYEKWGLVEKELQDLMLVLPASPQGLGMAIEAFLAIDKPTTLELLPKVKDAIQKPITFDQPLMSILKKEYKEPVLDWIAACAIWPKLSWDLTLYLGHIIGDHHNENLLSFAHLREMNRLPWFLQGQMPQRVREILLDYLAESDLEEKVRRSLDTLLDQNPPPKDSVAYQDYRMNIIINKLSLKPDTAARKKLEKEFAQYLAAGNKPDFVAFRLLYRPLSRLDTPVEHKLKQLAFKEGLPGLGLQWGLKFLMVWLVICVGIIITPSGKETSCNGKQIIYNNQILCMDNVEDWLKVENQLFYQDSISKVQNGDFLNLRILDDLLSFYSNPNDQINLLFESIDKLKNENNQLAQKMGDKLLMNLAGFSEEEEYRFELAKAQYWQIESVLEDSMGSQGLPLLIKKLEKSLHVFKTEKAEMWEFKTLSLLAQVNYYALKDSIAFDYNNQALQFMESFNEESEALILLGDLFRTRANIFNFYPLDLSDQEREDSVLSNYGKAEFYYNEAQAFEKQSQLIVSKATYHSNKNDFVNAIKIYETAIPFDIDKNAGRTLGEIYLKYGICIAGQSLAEDQYDLISKSDSLLHLALDIKPAELALLYYQLAANEQNRAVYLHWDDKEEYKKHLKKSGELYNRSIEYGLKEGEKEIVEDAFEAMAKVCDDGGQVLCKELMSKIQEFNLEIELEGKSFINEQIDFLGFKENSNKGRNRIIIICVLIFLNALAWNLSYKWLKKRGIGVRDDEVKINRNENKIIPSLRAIVFESELGMDEESMASDISKKYPDINIVFETSKVEDAIDIINNNQAELIFWDTNLHQNQNSDFLSKAKHEGFEIIFVSSSESYVIEAMRFGAVHYLIKPIDKQELKKALAKAKNNIAKNKRITRISVPISKGIRIINTRDIIYCKAQDNFTQIFFSNGEKPIMTPRNLGRIGDKLPTGQFMRIHNSHIVNLCHVKSFQKTAGGHVLMTGDTELKVAQPKKEQLLDALVNLDDICDPNR